MSFSCLFGFHNKRLVHSRTGSVGDFEWYDCKNCSKKLFTIDGGIWSNDKWKNNWHKTPEQDKEMYDENGKIRTDYLENYFSNLRTKEGDC